MKFAGKRVLITGGSSGIGFALAKILVKEGANVCLLARDSEKLAHARNLLDTEKNIPDQEIQTISADVSSPQSIFPAIRQYVSDASPIDYLINSAGVVHPGKFEDLSIDQFEWMIRINYLGTVYSTKAVIDGMIAKKSGHIINISSVAGFLGAYGYTAYSGSKFAVRGFSEVLRAELKLHNIKVSIVFPPDTQTPQLDYEMQYKPAITKALSGDKPLSAEYVANRILLDVSKGKYIITPGFDASFYYFLQGFLGKLSYPLMDYLTFQAARKVRKG